VLPVFPGVGAAEAMLTLSAAILARDRVQRRALPSWWRGRRWRRNKERMDDTLGIRQFGNNVLEAFIGVAAQSTPQGSCVTVLLLCGDPFIVVEICLLARRFAQFSAIRCPRCGMAHRCREPPAWLFSSFYTIRGRARNFSTCYNCHMVERGNAYEAALQDIDLLPEFRRQGFLAPGFCWRCQRRVQQYQLHFHYACPALTPGEPVSPLIIDDSDSSRGS
jgi:hypothetical protein